MIMSLTMLLMTVIHHHLQHYHHHHLHHNWKRWFQSLELGFGYQVVSLDISQPDKKRTEVNLIGKESSLVMWGQMVSCAVAPMKISQSLQKMCWVCWVNSRHRVVFKSHSRSPYSIKNSKRRDLCLVSGLYLCDDNFKVVVFNPENLMRKVSL